MALTKVAITGASGFLGRAISEHLRGEGYEVLHLVRREPRGSSEISWDPYASKFDASAIEGVSAVVHLSGAGIGDRRWTRKYKQTLIESRTVTTRFLTETLAALATPPRVFISASAIGYYGNRGDDFLSEDEPPGKDFAAQLCVRWEQAATPAVEAGIRTVHPRMGLVLAQRGGIIKKMKLPFSLGLGATLGPGTGWYSWVSLVDVVRGFQKCIEDDSLSGGVNLAAPSPVIGKEFMSAIAGAFGRKVHLKVPAAVLRVALGREMAESFLGSQRIVPAKLAAAGFEFEHEELSRAMRHYFGN